MAPQMSSRHPAEQSQRSPARTLLARNLLDD